MPTVTPGNALYLYRLLSREIGIGRQTMLSKIEEALLADDIEPADMGCEDVRTLLERLEFVRLTVFRRGRVYATVLSRPEWDTLLEQDEKDADKGAAGGGHKSWKRKKSAKRLRPERPRRRSRAAAKPQVETEARPKTEPASKGQPATKPMVETEPVAGLDPAAEAEPVVEPAPEQKLPAKAEPASAVRPTPVAKPESKHAAEADAQSESAEGEAPAAKAEPEIVATPESQSEPAVEPERKPATKPRPKPEPATAAEEEPDNQPQAIEEPVSEVQLDPPVAPEPETQPAAVAAPEVQPEPVPAAQPQSSAQSTPKVSIAHTPEPPLPHDLAKEAWCPTEPFSMLYSLLPLDVDPLALLAEDWRCARSTESYELHNGTLSFDLRCVLDDNQPVRATLRRQAATPGGKRWVLASIDGPAYETVLDFGGLPTANEGAWADLAGIAQDGYHHVNPQRELEQFASLGSWAQTLGTLAAYAEDEPWGPDLIELREYLAVTFHRVAREDKLVFSTDKRHASFDTGLLTAAAERIFANFDAFDDDIPWQLANFATEPCVDPAPAPAAYITELAHVCLAPPYTVRPSSTFARTYGTTLDTSIERAVLRAQRNHRSATPAYDPQTEQMRLLLPLCTNASGNVDAALVLAPFDRNGYEARAVLSLGRARTCARVVTSDLPAWL